MDNVVGVLGLESSVLMGTYVILIAILYANEKWCDEIVLSKVWNEARVDGSGAKIPWDTVPITITKTGSACEHARLGSNIANHMMHWMFRIWYMN